MFVPILTGAQEPEPEKTVERRLADVRAQVTEVTSNLADKTKGAFKKIQIHTSETATGIRWVHIYLYKERTHNRVTHLYNYTCVPCSCQELVLGEV